MKRLACAVVMLAACHGDPPRTKAGGSRADNQAHPASDGPVGLAIAVHGTELELTLENVSAADVQVATRVDHSWSDFDWLAVDLTGPDGKTRTLQFMSDRDESARIVTRLTPGEIDVERLDLAWWAVRRGEPLAPGRYQVTARWDASRETDVAAFSAEATTTMTVPEPVEGCATDGYQAPAGAKVQLLAYQVRGGGAVVGVGLHNAGTDPVCVWDRIATHEVQSDWLTIHTDAGTLELNDSREKSYPVAALLEPGTTSWVIWDLAAWAARDRNGKKALRSGWITAIYDSSGETEVWAGKVSADVLLTAP